MALIKWLYEPLPNPHKVLLQQAPTTKTAIQVNYIDKNVEVSGLNDRYILFTQLLKKRPMFYPNEDFII